MSVILDIKYNDKSFMLRNGREMPYEAYMRLKKQYGQGTNDNQIYNAYIQETRNDNQGENRPDANQERDTATSMVFGQPEQSVSIDMKKAEYILEHQNIFTKADIASAKKFFKL